MENFDVQPGGSGDAFGGLLDHPSNEVLTNQLNSNFVTGTITILNPTIAEVNAALAGLDIRSNWSSGTGSFTGAAFNYNIQVSYTPSAIATPEPATLELMTGGLIVLGLLARRKQLRFNRS
jgi:hypothetical protein